MSDGTTAQAAGESRRDFLELVTLSAAGIGAAAFAWPLIAQMNPSADVLALSSTEVDLSAVQPGMAISVMWRGKPVFIRNRTPEEIAEAEAVDIGTLRDPESDDARIRDGRKEWLIVLGVCTHLGCVPLGNKPTDNRGNFGGWFCPCHGSHYDTSGRIRQGPAPLNLPVPDYVYLSETAVRIG